jgi:hypothetical protein
MRARTPLLALVLLALAPPAVAYHVGTHARITLNAFQRSALLTDPTLLPNLGLPSLRYTQLGSSYYDVSGGLAITRDTFDYDYDHGKFPDPGVRNLVQGWMMRGAVREDDANPPFSWFLGLFGESSPLDAPNNINRFCNHFFDPLHATDGTNGGLSDLSGLLACGFSSRPSLQWASGSRDPLVPPSGVLEESARANHFTVRDAREAMWRALTGYDRDLVNKVATNGADRKAYWATTFRALGDVLHLNQDLAQPQHTRNEAHPISYYEQYVETRATRALLVRVTPAGTKATFQRPDLVYDGYATPRFRAWTRYWTTAIGEGSLSGRGLADYSSRGFFTMGHMWGDTTYPLPASNPALYTPQFVDESGVRKEYSAGPVNDTYAGTATTVKALRRSVFSELGGLTKFDTLDEHVFDEHASVLIPRAVGYSAGLLDWFFNPRLELSLPDEGAYAVVDHSGSGTQGFTQLLLKVKNVSPPLVEGASSDPQSLLGGTAVAVVKFHRNNCFRADLAGEYDADATQVQVCRENAGTEPIEFDDTAERIVVSKKATLALDAGATRAMKFDFSADPIPLYATDVSIQVVYRGPVGADASTADQDVVVVGTKDVSEPSYFSYFNASDYIAIGGKVYTRDVVAASQTLLGLVQPRACVTGSAGSFRLRDDCLLPFDLSMQLSFADLADPTVTVDTMPKRRYLRFVFLTDPAPPPAAARAPYARTAAARPKLRMSLSAGKHALATLSQRSVCYPLDPFDVDPGENQLLYDTDPPTYHSLRTSKLRGIRGYFQVSCVIDGDGTPPGSPDDRDTAMSDLDKAGAEGMPFAVTVKSAFIAP